tara:strand:+ start:1420 stop:1614 length:195 start_codon:yes stop_codon:yes gene_type:complete
MIFNTKHLDRLLDEPTKKEIKARAASLGCEMRYSGKLGKGFVHRVVRYDQYKKKFSYVYQVHSL